MPLLLLLSELKAPPSSPLLALLIGFGSSKLPLVVGSSLPVVEEVKEEEEEEEPLVKDEEESTDCCCSRGFKLISLTKSFPGLESGFRRHEMHAGHGNGPTAEEITPLPRHSLHTGVLEEEPEGRGQDEAGHGVGDDDDDDDVASLFEILPSSLISAGQRRFLL